MSGAWRWSFLALALTLATTVRAGVSLDLQLYYYGEGYFAFPSLRFNNATANPTNTGYFAWGPTSTQTSGIHYELYPGGSSSGGSSVYHPFNSFTQALQGTWSLMVTNETSTNFYRFTADVSGVSSNDFPPVTVTFPANAAVIAGQNPLFAWTGPTGWQGELRALVHNASYSFFRDAYLPTSATNWSSPDPLPASLLRFSARYSSNISARVSISTPLHTITAEPLPGWQPGATVETYRESEFTVSSGGGGRHTLIAHYPFDVAGDIGRDTSGKDNHISAGGSFGLPEHTSTVDALAGSGAVEFFGFSFLAPPVPVVTSLAGDFSVSVWVKTSQESGNNHDDARFGAGIIWADAGGDADTVPLALTGRRAAFYTGSADGSQQDTLHSQNDLSTGDYVHVVVTRSQATGEKRIYLDGVLDQTGVGSADLLDAPSDLFDLQIGAGNGGFEGLLDDLQFYTGVLSPDDIEFLYNNPGQTVPDALGSPLGEAVDAPGFTWITGGDADWFSQGFETHDGTDAAQSGAIGDRQESWIETTVAGPGSVSFWWNVSCQELFDFDDDFGGDRLSFELNGNLEDYISGDWGWSEYNLTLPPGLHTLRWSYRKDFASSEGADAGWLDEFVFDPNIAPEITSTPGDVQVFSGSNVVLSVELYGYPPPVIRWFKNGELLANYTQATLVLTNVQLSDSGSYHMSASNFLGTAATYGIQVTVFDPTDLQPLSLSAPALAGSQTLVPIMWVVTNTGPGYASNTVDHLYLMTNDTVAAFIGTASRPVGSTIPPGGAYTVSNWFRLPAVVAGDYSVQVRVDNQSNRQLELNETNNSLAVLISIVNPDLQPGHLQTDLTGVGGLPLQVRYNVTNNGPGILDGAGWTDHLVLSTDDQWSEDDLNLLQPGYAPTLGAGQYASRTNTVTLPVVPSGNYYLVVRVDRFGFSAYGNLREVNETNNQAAMPLQVTVPDLRPTQLVMPAQVSPKQPLDIEWWIQNFGDGVAQASLPGSGAAWFDTLYFSTNGLIHPGSVRLGQYFGNFYSAQDYIRSTPLPPGQIATNRQPFNIPNVAEGNYFIVLSADSLNYVREGNETNNLLAWPVTVASPDLTPMVLTAPATADANSPVQVSWTVLNQGAGDARPAWKDHLYLSTNNTFETTDLLLGEFSQGSVIPSGTNYSATQTVFLPGLAPGNYFLIFRADTATNLFESNVANNTRATAINIASPDLAVASLAAPTNGSSQQPITVTYSITNVGFTTAQPIWTDRLYLSTDPVLDAGDTPMFAVTGGAQNFAWAAPLPASQTYTQQVDVRLPALPAGDYHLLLLADGTNTFAEVNEANNVFAQAFRLNNPDLMPTDLIAPAVVTITQLNQHIEVGWSVLNQDTGSVFVTWFDSIYLSPTNVVDASAVLLSNEHPGAPLPGGQSYLAFQSASLPNGIQGSFYLLVQTDGGGSVFESVETNNLITQPIQIVVPPLPDLAVTAISAPSLAWSGQQIEVVWLLTNQGPAAAFGPFRDEVLLATSAGGAGLRSYGTFEFAGIVPPGASIERRQRITLPIDLSGPRWVVVRADVNHRVFEFDREGNNERIASQPVDVQLTPTPNLTVPFVTAPTDAFSGQQVLVTWAVTNQGAGPTSASFWYDAVYLSSDTNFGGGDRLLANVPNASYLAAGESYASSATVSLPRGFNGTYHFLVRCDDGNRVFEGLDETDNFQASGPMFVQLTPPPDLQVRSVQPPLTAFSGQTVNLAWTVTNSGSGQTLETTWSDRVYLSTNKVVDGADHLLGSYSRSGGLESGAGYLATNRVPLPVGVTGEWYFLVQCDAFSQVYEIPFELNNDGAADFTTLIALTPPPDLETTLLQTPATALASRAVTARYRVANNGSTFANGGWVDRLYLSTNTTFNAGEALLLAARTRHDRLLPGESYTNFLSAVLPDGLEGTFHLFLWADATDAVFELDNHNNIATAARPLEITSQPADLLVQALAAPAATEAGVAFLVSWAVTNRNVGDTAVTRWSDRLILSADDFLGDSDDLRLLDLTHDGLLAGTNAYAASNIVVTIPISTAPGEYRLFLVTDQGNAVYEGTNENNNASVPRPLTVTRQTADLQVASVSTPPTALAGESLFTRWTVRNEGSRAPNNASWFDAVYLSSDAFLSPSDLLLGARQNISSLLPGESYTNGLSVKLPRGLLGDYYLIVVTDSGNAVAEPGLEGNNSRVSAAPVAISAPPLPDLAVLDVQPPVVAYSGQPFEFTYTVTNAGLAAAPEHWFDAVYLSLDPYLDPFADTYLGFSRRAGAPLPGETHTNRLTFNIPQGYAGPFHVLVALDASDRIYEGGLEENNFGTHLLAMQVQLTPPVDLVAGPLIIPVNAAPGVRATLTYTVSNSGSNTALGSWEDALYISADTTWDIGDALFGRVRHRGDVPPGSNYTHSLTAPLPGVLPGNYHVIIRSDILNDLAEQNRANNLAASLDRVAVDAEPLVMGTPATGQIEQGQSVYYRFQATAGQTVRIRFTTGVPLAGNEIYVSSGQMPSRGRFDFAVTEPFVSDPDLFVPVVQTGTHYLLVYCGAMPVERPFSLLAEILPFTVATVQPAIAGDKGETTFKVRGALFDAGTRFELVSGTSSKAASRVFLEDSSTAYVTFDLLAATNGPRDLRAAQTGTPVTSTLSNALTVVSGAGAQVSVALDGPLSVWAFWTQPILLAYGNSGDADTAAPLLLVYGRNGTQIGLRRETLQLEPLQILGRSLDGPPNTLRPQTTFGLPMTYFGGGLRVEAREVLASDRRPLTTEDWLEIESSLRPPGVADAAWRPFWGNLQPRIGVTWGEYVQFVNRLAEPFPAEQRNVREMIGLTFTNNPGYRASSLLAGVLLDGKDASPRADVEIAFYRNATNGPSELGGSAITDAAGQFVIPALREGEYSLVLAGESFDMDRDGRPDATTPTVAIQNGSDLLNQQFYLRSPVSLTPDRNETSPSLLLDSQGALHAFFLRNERLWHSHRGGGQWIDAQTVSSNLVTSYVVASGERLIDGSRPGLLAVWSEGYGNSAEIFYTVGRTNEGGYAWARPIRLTTDVVRDTSPAVIVGPNGLALIAYLKRNAVGRDDTDLYFSVVSVASGGLVWRTPVAFGVDVLDSGKIAFGWSKEFGPYTALGATFKAGAEFNAEGSISGCNAEAKGEGKGSLLFEVGHVNIAPYGAVSMASSWAVNPSECAWEFNQMTLNGSGGVRVSVPDFALVMLSFHPPTAPFANRLQGGLNWMRNKTGIRVDHTVGIEGGVDFKNLRWTKDPAPTSGFRWPDSMDPTEAKLAFTIDFRAVLPEMDDTLVFNQDLSLVPASEPIAEASAGGKAEFVAEILPRFRPKSISGSVSFNCTVNGWKIGSEVVPLAYQFQNSPPTTKGPPPTTKDPPPNQFLPEGFTFTYAPETSVGTTNIFGTNSVLANVAADRFRDGRPSLARDGDDVPFVVWFKELDPYLGEFGSDLHTAAFEGTNWGSASIIPGTRGFNSQVQAAADALGRRMAVWVHADSSTITTNATAEEFFGARDAAEVFFAAFDGVGWSAPAPVALTAGRDTDVQVSTMANGDLLAVWTSVETNDTVRLLTAQWDTVAWSPVEEIAVGELSGPTAQDVAGVTHLIWSQVTGTNDSGTVAEKLFESHYANGTWSAPQPFAPQNLAPPAPRPFAGPRIANNPRPTLLPFDVVPEKCCKCKGPLKEEKEGQGTCRVGIRFDYEKCIKYFIYQACARAAYDPNDIVGPDGFGPERFVAATAPLHYTIRFENDPLLADAPAKQVLITLPLDDDFDVRTFRLGSFGFGDLVVPVPENSAFYQTRLDLRATRGFYLDFFAGVDVARREAFWRLTTVDPATGNLPLNPDLGFLPPNATSPEGEGFVQFHLRTAPGAVTGARLDARAQIIFDTQPPIDTPSIFNSVEAGVPDSLVLPLPANTNSTTFPVAWTGSDRPGESGVAAYDIYVSENGGDYVLWLEDTTLNQSPYVGEYGVQYAFFSRASDNAGNLEPAPSVPDAVIFITPPNTAPVVAAIADRTIVETLPFNFQVSATDTDQPPNTLTFELLESPAGMTINAASGLLSWTPSEQQGPGTNRVTFRVADNGTPSLSATNSFTLVVLETNTPPAFVGPDHILVDEQVELNLAILIADADLPTNKVTLALLSGPMGATFDALSGVFNWSPTEADGPSTNVIVLRATDDGSPPSTTLRTNILVVREVNRPPVFEPVTNLVVPVFTSARVRLLAADPDEPTNTFTLRLGSNAPPTARLDAATGNFRWTPPLEAAGTSNLITVVATDDGVPSLTATQQFAVIVPHAVLLEAGSTNLLTGQTGSVPLRVVASAPWQALSFELDLPPGALDAPALDNVVSPFTTASLLPLTPERWRLAFTNAPGRELSGDLQLADLRFLAVAARSASFPLAPQAFVTWLADGSPAPTLLTGQGRVIAVANEPVLEALRPVGSRDGLTLYGNPGQSYELQIATNLTPPVLWLPFTQLTLTNLTQDLEGQSNGLPLRLYRVQQR